MFIILALEGNLEFCKSCSVSKWMNRSRELVFWPWSLGKNPVVLPTHSMLFPPHHSSYFTGNSPREALLLLSDFGVIATACSDMVSFSSAAQRRAWPHTFPVNRGRQMPSEQVNVCPPSHWTQAPTMCVHVQAESHFPFANSELSSNNSLWWDLSPEAVMLPCGSLF